MVLGSSAGSVRDKLLYDYVEAVGVAQAVQGWKATWVALRSLYISRIREVCGSYIDWSSLKGDPHGVGGFNGMSR